MGQNKLERFAAMDTFPNVLQYPEGMAGKWAGFFGNSHPVTLELACGKGELSTGLGAMQPTENFIGVDVKGNRQYIGARKALRESLNNVAFLRTRIERIADYFAEGEVSQIWIMFPDPFLRDGKAKNRLTHPRFLAQYQRILQRGGLVHLKTDSPELFDFTHEIIATFGCRLQESISDVYASGKNTGALSIQTFYEQGHLAKGRTIQYVSFALPEAPIALPKKINNNSGAAEGR